MRMIVSQKEIANYNEKRKTLMEITWYE